MAFDLHFELSPTEEAALRAWALQDGRTLAETVVWCLRALSPEAHAVRADRQHRRHQQALLELAKCSSFASGGLQEALEAVTVAAAQALEVERVGVWLYDPPHTAIRCIELYERSGQQHSSGTELLAQTCPAYFQAIATNRAVVASDARRDPRTLEFTESYLIPLGITSMLDAPLKREGQTIGVVCMEHVGPQRVWTREEEAFAASIADMLALAFEREDRRHAEREASRHALELEKQRELQRIKTNMVSMVSHELRTPLTAIVGYVEFLADELGGALTPQQREYVEQIAQHAAHLRRLVDDLLDFARIEAGLFHLVREDIDLGQQVRSVAEDHRARAVAKGVALEVRAPMAPVMAFHDALRFGQILANLLSNAIKFTPAGGSVIILLKEEAGGSRVEVQDTGIGIAPEHLPHLFDRFYQVDSSTTREQSGVGLGLSIAKSLVELMGGRIGVSCDPARGCTFWFTLPRRSVDAPPGGARASRS